MRAVLPLLLVAMAAPARAEPSPAIAARAEPAPRRTLLYVELLGKGGPYGVGVERSITPRLALGAVGSYAIVGGQHLATAAPYLHATIVRGGHHALFGELAAMLVHSRVPSPVLGWDGTSDTGGGGMATVGWELNGRQLRCRHCAGSISWGRRLVLRTYLAVAVGEGGVAPWMGIVFGVRP